MEEEIGIQGSFPITAPVNPYTELADIFNANCRPSKTARLKGAVSYFKSDLALLRANKRSSKMVGKSPFRRLDLTNMSVQNKEIGRL